MKALQRTSLKQRRRSPLRGEGEDLSKILFGTTLGPYEGEALLGNVKKEYPEERT